MERVSIDKVFVDPVTMKQAVDRVSRMLEEPRERAAHVVTMNAQFVEIAHQEERFADLAATS
jgi:UDP-N-acetyl-D-mannosaminuronic acid transferase (WecB/TagA/CpsF family)